ncbi:hypothetical protein [Aliivibrio salmonicida]|uniref:hypothetical protein n=1 Tax=Aliivibrio salmonicida TaxID=40269 RepID=UPI003D137FB4
MSLSPEEKVIATQMAKDKFTVKQIAEKLKQTYNVIYSLKREGVVFTDGKYRIPSETVESIKAMIAKGGTNTAIGIKLNVKSEYVSAIRHGRIREHREPVKAAPKVKHQDLLNSVFG